MKTFRGFLEYPYEKDYPNRNRPRIFGGGYDYRRLRREHAGIVL